MTERKWTGGPWLVVDETLYGTDFGYTVPLMDLGFYEDNERYQADAHLIAAAPELYEALEGMVAIYGKGSGPISRDAHAALAKARG